MASYLFCRPGERLGRADELIGRCFGLGEKFLRAHQRVISAAPMAVHIDSEFVQFLEFARTPSVEIPGEQAIALRIELNHTDGLVIGNPDRLISAYIDVIRTIQRWPDTQ